MLFIWYLFNKSLILYLINTKTPIEHFYSKKNNFIWKKPEYQTRTNFPKNLN